jgi:hypothetical protein
MVLNLISLERREEMGDSGSFNLAGWRLPFLSFLWVSCTEALYQSR